LQKELSEANEKICKLEKDLEDIGKASRLREKELGEKIDKLKEEVKDWMFKNSKLASQAEYNEQKSKILEANLQVRVSLKQSSEKLNNKIL